MESEVDLTMVALFGSETRVRVLAVLAGAYGPLTAYRVGKTGGVSMPKAYREIGRLHKAGIVARKGAG
ncbi:MAG: helix-turn-helix domain-containing protein, partial [Thermoplasmata archaeon]